MHGLVLRGAAGHQTGWCSAALVCLTQLGLGLLSWGREACCAALLRTGTGQACSVHRLYIQPFNAQHQCAAWVCERMHRCVQNASDI
jgi:hypothetical protein